MNTLIQVIVGGSVCLLVLLFTLYMYHRDAINEIRRVQASKKPRNTVEFITGIVDPAGAGGGTVVPMDELPFSINQKGGAEVTYNFWVLKAHGSNVYGEAEFNRLTDRLTSMGAKNVAGLNENATCDAGLHYHDIPLLLKGENKLTKFSTMCSPVAPNRTQYKQDILVKCPLVKFDRGTNRLTVQFNTYGGPDAVEDGAILRACTDNGSGSWAKKTQFQFSADGLDDDNYIGKWFMVTVVLRDTTTEGIYPIRNKVNCRIYINGVKVVDKFAAGTLDEKADAYSVLRQNRSPLHILPKIMKMAEDKRATFEIVGAEKLQMAGGRYFNYALEDVDIVALFKERFVVRPTVTVRDVYWSERELVMA